MLDLFVSQCGVCVSIIDREAPESWFPEVNTSLVRFSREWQGYGRKLYSMNSVVQDLWGSF